ncbi:hypothetical protein FDA94_17160 [Herbidospora galbida]|uniref:VWA domain-containing protein n=1 Tax=Herbidospora galbida TaxID=2575442 RepID=A0A4U3MGT7_9ACTN|nr:hypothetical protein [Herbidospora galbida]TKK87554.1 hypothetical protein FDA94_17160 [Herbidospora galbida]
MGWGHWSDNEFHAAQIYRQEQGLPAFGHTEEMRRRPRHLREVHDKLNPYHVRVREARDSQEHPESLAVAVFFDVTGSMQRVPRELQERLPSLLSTVTALVPDAQIMFGAVGDAKWDRAPLQIGQFESDNRMDQDLRDIYLEGGGGGGMEESYELALYFLARHTALDCHEKRGVKGVAFVIGDEMPYPSVAGSEVARLFGESMVKDVRTETVVKEASRTWDINMIIPGGTSHAGDQQVSGLWRTLLGDRVIELDDISSICDTIALTVVDRVMSQKAH